MAEVVHQKRSELGILPVAMRVVDDIVGLDDARDFARDQLKPYLDPSLDEDDRMVFWTNAEVPHYPAYGFEETLATFAEPAGGRNNLLSDMEWLADYLAPGNATLRLPRMPAKLRERYLRRFKFRDPRLAWLKETLELDPDQAVGQIREEIMRARKKGRGREWLRQLAESLRQIAERALRLGKSSLAESAIQEALILSQSIEDLLEEARSLRFQADLMVLQGDLNEALSLLQGRTLSIFERQGDEPGRALTMGKIADIFERRGETDETLRIHIEERLPAAEAMKDLDSIAHIRYSCAPIPMWRWVSGSDFRPFRIGPGAVNRSGR